MWYALVSVGSFVAGIAVTLFFAAVIADDPFPPTRTELGYTRGWTR